MIEAFTRNGPAMESNIPTDDCPDLATDPAEDDDGTSYASGDSLGKLWAFINQVRAQGF